MTITIKCECCLKEQALRLSEDDSALLMPEGWSHKNFMVKTIDACSDDCADRIDVCFKEMVRKILEANSESEGVESEGVARKIYESAFAELQTKHRKH